MFGRYRELQQYVGWTDADARTVQACAPLLLPHLSALVDDFYAEIQRHPNAMKVVVGGPEQIVRLKGTLTQWLKELFAGPYDAAYVERRWRVGLRHVEIGLDQVYTNVALARLREGLLTALDADWTGDAAGLLAARRSLNLLIDLDLAIIEDAYQTEYFARQQQRSDEAFRTLIEAAPCMIVILRADHRVLYFSPFAEELTGYRADEVLGKEYFSIFIPDPTMRETISAKKKSILEGIPTRGFESIVRCKDGSSRSMMWNAQLLPNYKGEPAILAVGQDITSLKQIQEQTLQTERLAAIGQMMTGLAHESGNALARSQACLEMLAFAVENQPKALNLIARIQAAQDHLKQLYDEVRNYAAPLKLQIESWNITLIWRQAWQNLALHRQGKIANLHEQTGGIDLKIPVDQFRLEQVFRNIFDNSLAACSDPIEINVVCSPADLNGAPAIRISCLDNGPGLNAEQEQRIFDPFFTTKTKGTGLGMAIAKRIIEAHGGRIGVGASGARGAEIYFLLPVNKS